MTLNCPVCGTAIKRTPSKISKTGNNFCSHQCRAQHQMHTTRNIQAVKRYVYWREQGCGFNEACRRARISRYTGHLIKAGFYDQQIPHSRFFKDDKTESGYFDVNEMN